MDTTATEPAVTLADLLDALHLRPIGEERGASLWQGGPQAHPDDRLFGGMLLAQSLVAAGRTVSPRAKMQPISLPADFIAGVPTDRPLRWRVEDPSQPEPEASLCSRRSTLVGEDGSELFTAVSRWATVREELVSHHSVEPLPAPGPDGLVDLIDRCADDPRIPLWWRIQRPVLLRHLQDPPYLTPARASNSQTVFAKATGALPDDVAVRAAVAAYVSDMSLLEPAFRALGGLRFGDGGRVLSLTHTLTFHALPDLSGWHQIDCRISAVAHGRALGTADFFDSTGAHVLTASQLGLIKPGR